MRVDGRAADELRAVTMEPGYQEFAEGSVLISMGKTRVLCSATVQETVPSWLKGSNQGWVTAEYAMLPRSTQKRTPRRPSGRATEIQRFIGRSLRGSLMLGALGERMITVDCDVIQADGGTRTAAITGGYVALALAVEELVRRKQVRLQVWKAPVAAVSVGLVDGELLLDLNYAEDSRAEVDANVVMNARGQMVDIGATAEGEPFAQEQLDRMIELAGTGIRELNRMQGEILGR
jgi:ribonuclease PH